MSKCISGQGEYSDHVGGDEEFVCGRCYVVDEEAMRAEIERLRTTHPSVTDDARAEAWDEGARATAHAAEYLGTYPPNPYRAAGRAETTIDTTKETP